MERKSNEVIINEVREGNIRGILRANTSEQNQIKNEILNDGNELEKEPPANKNINVDAQTNFQKDSLS